MNVTVKARHMDITDSIRDYVETKADKLDRYLVGLQNAEVIIDMEADKPVVEIVARAKKKNTFVATHRDDDMYACIDVCLDKVIQQLRRHKDKLRDHHPQHGQGS